MSNSDKSKAFADLVLSMNKVERIAMARDLLGAIDADEGIPKKLGTNAEIERVAEVLEEMAHNIVMYHPGGTGW